MAFLGNGVSLLDEIIGLRFDIATTTFLQEKKVACVTHC